MFECSPEIQHLFSTFSEQLREVICKDKEVLSNSFPVSFVVEIGGLAVNCDLTFAEIITMS